MPDAILPIRCLSDHMCSVRGCQGVREKAVAGMCRQAGMECHHARCCAAAQAPPAQPDVGG